MVRIPIFDVEHDANQKYGLPTPLISLPHPSQCRENGSGKTTVLEAINFLLEGSSNRTKDNSECITEGKGGFKLGLKGELGSKDLILKATKNLKKTPTCTMTNNS